MSLEAPESRIDATVRILGLVLTTLVGLLMLGKLLYWCRAGFNFTDEAFYLLSVDHPETQKIWAMQFAQVLWPLWWVTGKNVVLYRQVNIVIYQILGFALSWLLLRRGMVDAGRWALIAIAFASATIVNSFLMFYLPTPNYNHLAAQSLLLASIGIVALTPEKTRANTMVWILIGLSGALAFLAKPTTAAVLAVFTMLYVLLSGKARLKGLMVAIGVSTGSLLLFGWVVHGSPKRFVSNLYEGYLDIQTMGGHAKSLLRLAIPPIPAGDGLICLAIVACVALGVVCSAYRSQFLLNLDRTSATRSVCRTVWISLLALSGYLTLREFFGGTQWPANWILVASGLFLVGMGSLVGSALSWRQTHARGVRRDAWCKAGWFTLLPYAYAFGTSNNYVIIMLHASVFWIYAGIGLLADLAPGVRGHRAVIFLIAAAQVFLVSNIDHGIEKPYKQPPMLDAHECVVLGEGGRTVLLSTQTARIIADLRDCAARAGFKPGMALLDLTGTGPGLSFVLRAKPIDNAWLIGGRDTTWALTQRLLDRAGPEVIRRAWILADPDGMRSITENILERYGLSLEADYLFAGKMSVKNFHFFRPKAEPHE